MSTDIVDNISVVSNIFQSMKESEITISLHGIQIKGFPAFALGGAIAGAIVFLAWKPSLAMKPSSRNNVFHGAIAEFRRIINKSRIRISSFEIDGAPALALGVAGGAGLFVGMRSNPVEVISALVNLFNSIANATLVNISKGSLRIEVFTCGDESLKKLLNAFASGEILENLKIIFLDEGDELKIQLISVGAILDAEEKDFISIQKEVEKNKNQQFDFQNFSEINLSTSPVLKNVETVLVPFTENFQDQVKFVKELVSNLNQEPIKVTDGLSSDEEVEKKDEEGQLKKVEGKSTDILLVGGLVCPQRVVQYNIKSQEFTLMPDTKVPGRVLASASSCRGFVYLMGGCSDDGITFDSVEILNLHESTLKWKIHQTSMIEGRRSFASTVLNGKIYCVGGGNGTQILSSVNYYDPEIGKWFKSKKMDQARRGHAMVSARGKLYVFGGRVEDDDITNTAVCFDPNIGENGKWRNISSMKECRVSACAVLLRSSIFVMGGWDGSNFLSSVEKFDLDSKMWEEDIALMKEKRSGAGACVVDDQIYVFGGEEAKTVEVYDFHMNVWNTEVSMDRDRRWLSVVSI